MSNDLTRTNNQVAVTGTPNPNATPVDFRRDSKTYPRIVSYPREQAVVEMSKIVMNAFLYKGQQADPTNIQFISCSLVDELQSDQDRIGTKFISFAEIARAVKKAVLGGSDMFGLNVASFYKVITEYIKTEGYMAEKEIVRQKRLAEQEALKKSIVAPMMKVYAGALKRKMEEDDS